MATITKAAVIEGFREVVDVLSTYSSRFDHEVELIVRADGTASLMVDTEGAASSFEEDRRFDSLEEMYDYLRIAVPEEVRP